MSAVEAPAEYDYDRIPYLVAFQNNSGVRDTYGGVAELVVMESYLLKPKDKPSDTVLVFMHPIGGGAYLPMINALARGGHHVIYCNSRFRGTDGPLRLSRFPFASWWYWWLPALATSCGRVGSNVYVPTPGICVRLPSAS